MQKGTKPIDYYKDEYGTHPLFGQIDEPLDILGTGDVNLTGLSGILRVGDIAGVHMAFDQNEIMAKATPTTASDLYFGGSQIHLRIGETEKALLDSSGVFKINGNTAWHAGNDGSGSGLDADLLEGYHAQVYAGGNTIVLRHPDGYIFANYFNTGCDVNSSITHFMVDSYSDGYIRKVTFADVLKMMHPIGSIYIQFYGKSDPGTLFGGTWTDKSSDFAGRFFRATGGNAAAWGTAQDDAFQGHEHSHVHGTPSTGVWGDDYDSELGWHDTNGIKNKSGYGTARYNTETRPTNYAVKIWERTA